jgi:hypothetical protein
VVSEILGHASIAITKDVYGHAHVAPSVALASSGKAPSGSGKVPLTWTRSEGLEPPAF